MIVEINSFQEVYETTMAIAMESAKSYFEGLGIWEGWYRDETFGPFGTDTLCHYEGGFIGSAGLLPCILAPQYIHWGIAGCAAHWPHGPNCLCMDGTVTWALNGQPNLSLFEYLDQVDLPMEEKLMLKLRWA